jgi:cystathionine beta-lyase
MKYDFDSVIKRRGTSSAKWDTMAEGVLAMWVADMDFRCAPEIVSRIKAKAAEGLYGYPYYGKKVQQAVVDWMAKRHGWQIKVEDVVPTLGVVVGFHIASNAVAKRGDGYLIQTPTYGQFFTVEKNLGLRTQVSELAHNLDGSYSVDLDEFEAAIDEGTRIFMLCNPQNPTGKVFSKDELLKMGEICLKHDVVICSDEIHSDIVYKGNKHIPIASLSDEIAQNTITLMAPSKTFNVAGFQASAAIIQNPELRKKYIDARMGMTSWMNMMGSEAIMASYEEGGAWLEELLVYLEGNRDALCDFVEEEMPGIRVWKPESTFLAWLDCRGSGIEGNLGNFFREKAKVGLIDGNIFGQGGEGFVRFNFGCPRAVLMEGLERMRKAIVDRHSK